MALIVRMPNNEWANSHVASLLKEATEVLAEQLGGDTVQASLRIAILAKRAYERESICHRHPGRRTPPTKPNGKRPDEQANPRARTVNGATG